MILTRIYLVKDRISYSKKIFENLITLIMDLSNIDNVMDEIFDIKYTNPDQEYRFVC